MGQVLVLLVYKTESKFQQSLHKVEGKIDNSLGSSVQG